MSMRKNQRKWIKFALAMYVSLQVVTKKKHHQPTLPQSKSSLKHLPDFGEARLMHKQFGWVNRTMCHYFILRALHCFKS